MLPTPISRPRGLNAADVPLSWVWPHSRSGRAATPTLALPPGLRVPTVRPASLFLCGPLGCAPSGWPQAAALGEDGGAPNDPTALARAE